MNLPEAASCLNVGLEVVQKFTAKLVCESKVEEFQLVGEEVIKASFFDRAIRELALELSEGVADRVDVSDLSSRYQLPLAIIRAAIGERMDLLPPGSSLKNNCVVGGAWAEREEAKARGILRACTRPALLSQLSQRYGFDDLKFRATVDQLVSRKQLQGKVSKGVFTPRSFQN